MNNPLRWSAELIDSFAKNGVSHAIISPGSRSTPLTIAAALHPHISKKIILDERSAGFTALGIGKATGKPALLICTSGTAAANYLPAVVEARESGVPLIILSADRPPNLRGIGSSQTIDQLTLFGNYPVFFHEAGEPAFEPRDINRLRYLAKQAVIGSVQKGGAAHINLPFRKPLEPEISHIAGIRQLYAPATVTEKKPVSATTSNVTPSTVIQNLISQSKKPLIIAGPANPHHQLNETLQKISARLNAPVLAEPGSGYSDSDQSILRFEQFLRNKKIYSELAPDVIIRFGAQPFTKSLITVLDQLAGIPVIQFASNNKPGDHALSVTHTINLQPSDSLHFQFVQKRSDNDWLKRWKKADRQAETALEKTVQTETRLTDGHVFYTLHRILDKSWNVMLSNSFPARDMALFGGTSAKQFVNRGAAGIDGIASTAAGIHLTETGPTCCLIGDLAFLHDSNALQLINRLQGPFLMVIINNKGGTIFRMLPMYKNSAANNLPPDFFTTYFETPQQTNIELLVRASGIDYLKIDTLQKLHEFNPATLKTPLIVECVTNTDASMKMRNILWDF